MCICRQWHSLYVHFAFDKGTIKLKVKYFLVFQRYLSEYAGENSTKEIEMPQQSR